MADVEHINPPTLTNNPAFTQVISVPSTARTIYVGGQNALDLHRNLIGRGDLAQQTDQACENLQLALEAAGAKLEHLVKCTIYLVAGQQPSVGFQAWLKLWGDRPHPPTVSVLLVAGLANPEFLIEIDAIAAVP